jgi:hypothetical protein
MRPGVVRLSAHKMSCDREDGLRPQPCLTGRLGRSKHLQVARLCFELAVWPATCAQRCDRQLLCWERRLAVCNYGFRV